jgi:hypothetical protein
MIVACEKCGRRYSTKAGGCPDCAAGAAKPVALRGEQAFFGPIWALALAIPGAGAALIVGVYAALRYEGQERVGALLMAAFGAAILMMIQLKITVGPRELKVRYLLFTRRFAIADIADVVNLTTVITRYGVESDRVRSVKLRMRDRGEISLRPGAASVEPLIEAIQAARGAGSF